MSYFLHLSSLCITNIVSYFHFTLISWYSLIFQHKYNSERRNSTWGTRISTKRSLLADFPWLPVDEPQTWFIPRSLVAKQKAELQHFPTFSWFSGEIPPLSGDNPSSLCVWVPPDTPAGGNSKIKTEAASPAPENSISFPARLAS